MCACIGLQTQHSALQLSPETWTFAFIPSPLQQRNIVNTNDGLLPSLSPITKSEL